MSKHRLTYTEDVEQAKAKVDLANIRWQQADAMKLPFADASFDLVVCQFGVMFFADKQIAFGEARRVLRPEGNLLFVVWEDWKLIPAAPLAIAADACHSSEARLARSSGTQGRS